MPLMFTPGVRDHGSKALQNVIVGHAVEVVSIIPPSLKPKDGRNSSSDRRAVHPLKSHETEAVVRVVPEKVGGKISVSTRMVDYSLSTIQIYVRPSEAGDRKSP